MFDYSKEMENHNVYLFRNRFGRYGLISEADQRIIAPPLMNEELLYLFHMKEYIEFPKKGEKGSGYRMPFMEQTGF